MYESGGDALVADLGIHWPKIPHMLAATQEEFRPKLETTVEMKHIVIITL